MTQNEAPNLHYVEVAEVRKEAWNKITPGPSPITQESLTNNINATNDRLQEIINGMQSDTLQSPGNPQLQILDDAFERVRQLFANKNTEYGDGGDILANFRRLADQQGIPMSSAWFFLAGKHLDVITQYVKEHREGVGRYRTQALSERVDDIIVYSFLLLVILDEETQ